MLTGPMIEKSMRDDQNLTVMLKDADIFSMTGYKVLQSQEKDGFVKCRKVTHNGRPELWYDIAQYDSLDTAAGAMDTEKLAATLAELATVLQSAEKNGFMDTKNIPLSLSYIFISRENRKPYLLYLPVQKDSGAEDSAATADGLQAFLDEVRRMIGGRGGSKADLPPVLRKIMDDEIRSLDEFGTAAKEEKKEEGFEKNTSARLSGTSGTLYTEYVQPVSEPEKAREKKGFFSKVFKKGEKEGAAEESAVRREADSRAGTADHGSPAPAPAAKAEAAEEKATGILATDDGEKILVLTGLNTPEECILRITMPEYRIGKKRDSVDGCITFSNAVSRVHCRIAERGGRYYVEDMGSANGTFINGMRINPGREFPLTPGDTLKMADLEFRADKVRA